MKNVFEHIEHIKGKPHHIRKRVAFTAAATGAGAIALVWLVGSLSYGLFAIQGSSFADATNQQESVIVTNGETSRSAGLAGAAAALPTGRQGSDANAAAHIEIVDTRSTTTLPKKAEQTVIPF